MAEVGRIPSNGRVVASLFSGGGGSSLGYKMAGFDVRWASEFVEAARDTYRANFPKTVVDERDVRDVKGSDVLKALGMKVGELDVLDGSPPCASFSTAGRREKGWGQVKKYSDREQRTDDLFFEYARILGDVQPKVFVAENVAGLVKGSAKGYFKEILAALKAKGYRVRAAVLDAQWLGVPQARRRLIFVGVRKDLGVEPAHPRPLPYRYSVREAIPWIDGSARVVHDQGSDVGYSKGDVTDGQSPPITMGSGSNHAHFKVVGSAAVGTKRGARSANAPAPTILTHGNMHTHSEVSIVVPRSDTKLTPCLDREWERTRVGDSSEKYFSLVKADPAKPCPTVTQTAGTQAAGVVHPLEKRKFTIAEVRRICSFPDDFVLTGTYAQQWERCGRAVPPLMMRAVAEALRDQVFAKL